MCMIEIFWQKLNEPNNYAIIEKHIDVKWFEEWEQNSKIAENLTQTFVDTESAHHEWHNTTTIWWQCGRNSM